MKKRIGSAFVVLVLVCGVLTSCGNAGTQDPSQSQGEHSSAGTHNDTHKTTLEAAVRGDSTALYDSFGAQAKAAFSSDALARMLADLAQTGGSVTSVGDAQTQKQNDGVTYYSYPVSYKNLSLTFSLGVQNNGVISFTRSHYKHNGTFLLDRGEGVKERRFVLQNGEFALNAAYTYLDDGNKKPSALLVSGSGPSDLDEMIGINPIFGDLALALAKEGVNTLRVDKVTAQYPEKFGNKDGLQQEYIDAYLQAFDQLYADPLTDQSRVYIVGHSLGGMIAPHLYTQVEPKAKGVVCLMSTARSMAALTADQLIRISPDQADATRAMLAKIESLTPEKLSGEKLLAGLSDYYWYSYREIHAAQTIKEKGIRALALTSNNDSLSLPADVTSFQEQLAGIKSAQVKIYDDPTHYLYAFDLETAPYALYARNEIPHEIIQDIASFILA